MMKAYVQKSVHFFPKNTIGVLKNNTTLLTNVISLMT